MAMNLRDLRIRMNAIIRTDADLDALCLDYFLEIKRQFSAGMNRTQKENLILELADPVLLEKALQERESERLAAAPPSQSPGAARPAGLEKIESLFSQIQHMFDISLELLNFNVNMALVRNAAEPKGVINELSGRVPPAKSAVEQCRQRLVESSFRLKIEDKALIESVIGEIKQQIERLETAVTAARKMMNPPALLLIISALNQIQPSLQSLHNHKQDIEQRLRQYQG